MTKTICWNAIVKNESAVIKRCMQAMVKYIDYWVVVDTGSTDGTQNIIKDFMREHNIPGELIERPWVNFSHNRSEALELAENKADYILLCDADMELRVNNPNWKNELGDTALYSVIQVNNVLRYSNVRLVNGRLKGRERCRYWGATHEYCDSIKGGAKKEYLKSIEFWDHTDGGSKSDKFERDALLLLKELDYLSSLEKVDEDTKKKLDEEGLWNRREGLIQRCTFYLAQTWRDSNKHELALTMYEKRVSLGGWQEEVYYSLLQIALLKEKLDYSFDDVVKAYITAYEYRIHRAESLYELSRYLRQKDRIKLAYIYANIAAKIPLSKDVLFVNYPIYEWKAKDELAIAAYWSNEYQLCYDICLELLNNKKIPQGAYNRIQKNLEFAMGKLGIKMDNVKTDEEIEPAKLFDYNNCPSVFELQQKVSNDWDKMLSYYFDNKLETFTIKAKRQDLVGKKIIWQYWAQGVSSFNDIPELNKVCFLSVDKYKEDYEVIRLDDDNFIEYVEFPEFILNKKHLFKICFFSDLLRLALLSNYGGIWIDATILLTANIPNNIKESDLFMYQRDDNNINKEYWEKINKDYFCWDKKHKVNILNSFIVARPNNKVIDMLLQLLLNYWKVKDKIPYYYIFHVLFDRLIKEHFTDYQIEVIDDTLPHALYMNLWNDYEKYKFDEICEKVSVHKLSNRLANCSKTSLWEHIKNIYLYTK